MSAGRAIYGIRRRVVRHEKSKIMIHIGKGRIDDLRSHEIGEDFLHPDVVEPLHRDEAAEPHMRRLMRDGTCAIKHLIFCSGFIEQYACSVVEDRTRMFHAAELKRRNQNKIEFTESIGNSGVLLKPVQGRGMEIENGFFVSFDLLRVCLAMKHAIPPTVTFRGLHLKLAGGESE